MMIIFVVGPTAVGKSEAALDIAEKIGAEIINADAMQLYRGMDVGTAKVSIHDRRGITHHMLDVLDVTEEASVAVYQRKVRDILENDSKSYVVVGGSGLYISSLLQDLKFPPSNSDVRSQIELRGIEIGAAALHNSRYLLKFIQEICCSRRKIGPYFFDKADKTSKGSPLLIISRPFKLSLRACNEAFRYAARRELVGRFSRIKRATTSPSANADVSAGLSPILRSRRNHIIAMRQR